MPIVSADIKYRLSGGASNSDQNASLGGVKSSNEASASLFDNVSSAEAVSGDTEYRCFYVLFRCLTSICKNNIGKFVAFFRNTLPSR